MEHMKIHYPTVPTAPSAEVAGPVHDWHVDSPMCPPDLVASLPEETHPEKLKESVKCAAFVKRLFLPRELLRDTKNSLINSPPAFTVKYSGASI